MAPAEDRVRRPIGCMRLGIGKLYHLAEASNLASILQHGLMSTERLLDLACVAKPERDALLRVHRPDNIRLSDSMVIRDQRPMPPAALVRALDGGLKPSDWYALLNSFVFPGPTRSAWRGSGAPAATAPRSCSRSTQMLYSELRTAMARPATAPGFNAPGTGRGSGSVSKEIPWRQQKTESAGRSDG